jgi:hypothetical protein
MAMLAASRLPPEVRRLLPDGAERWPQTGTDRSRRGLRSLMERERVVLHYDIAAPARRQESYAQDPVLAGIASARQVTVVEVRPPPDRLVEQIQSRSEAREAQRGWSSRAWRRSALRSFLQLRKRLRRKNFPSKPLLYQQPGWVEACYGRWDAFTAQALAARDGAVLIRLEPTPGPDGSPSFRQIESKEIRPAARVP